MLYTIGTSNRTETEFFSELARRDVWLVVDVRSRPYSRFPWANGKQIAATATRYGMHYAFGGELLGGLCPVPTTARAYQVAVEAILEATCTKPVAIFCAEGDPAQCHRSWKIAAHALVTHGVVASNILRNGREEDVTVTLARTRAADVPACLRPELAKLGL